MAGEIIQKTESADKPFEAGEALKGIESESVMYREDIDNAKEQFSKTLDDINARLRRLVSGQTLGEKIENTLDMIFGDNQREFDEAVRRVDQELNMIEQDMQSRLAQIEAEYNRDGREFSRDPKIASVLETANAELQKLLSTRIEAIAVAQETVPGSDTLEAEEAVAYAEAKAEQTLEERQKNLENAVVEDNALGTGMVRNAAVAMKGYHQKIEDAANQ